MYGLFLTFQGKLSCYGTRWRGGRAYVTRVPGHGGAEAIPGTAWESLATTEEPYLDFRKAWQRRQRTAAM